MNSCQHLCFNGKYYPQELTLFGTNNRAFRYGDSLFETLHAQNGKIQFLQDHLNRLTRGMQILGMTKPKKFTLAKIEAETIHLLNKNKLYGAARIRLSVFRNQGGLYTPTDNNISYVIEASTLDKMGYTLNKKGWSIGIYDQMRKPVNILSPFKTGNALPFILAGIYRSQHQWDDCLLLNDRNQLVEGLSSNLFMVKNNILMTPSLESGCVAGIMRERVIESALDLGITVYDDCTLTPQDMYEADELFLTNAIWGIRWIVAYEHRRFFHRISELLTQKLNQQIFNS